MVWILLASHTVTVLLIALWHSAPLELQNQGVYNTQTKVALVEIQGAMMGRHALPSDATQRIIQQAALSQSHRDKRYSIPPLRAALCCDTHNYGAPQVNNLGAGTSRW